MTKEEKDLLLRDLCARLPYGVEVEYDNSICEVLSIDKDNEELTVWKNYGYSPDVKLEEVRPYLFPISSMTEEQKEDMIKSSVGIGSDKNVFDWYNKNHFDYRDLIPMGLANDATELNIY